MDIIADGLESLTTSRRRKPIFGRNVPAAGIESIYRRLCIPFWLGIPDEPFHINDDVLPAERFQIFGHPPRVRLELLFINRGSITVPAVPTHGRLGRKRFVMGARRSLLLEPPSSGSACRDQDSAHQCRFHPRSCLEKNCFRVSLQTHIPP